MLAGMKRETQMSDIIYQLYLDEVLMATASNTKTLYSILDNLACTYMDGDFTSQELIYEGFAEIKEEKVLS